MKDAAICVFAWDFADEGLDFVLGEIAEAGLSSFWLASTYHAGWFVLPHNPLRLTYMPEDGVAYFHPQSRFFDETPLKPLVGSVAAMTDWFAEAADRLERFGLEMTAWTVCNHNTRLGLKHPEHTVQNALGDSYPHALTPASPAVRCYVRGLACNLASQYPLRSLFLEAPNYRGRRHGHHHERELTPLGALEQELLDISFSPHDMRAAAEAGIDAEPLRQAIVAHVRRYLEAVPQRPTNLPETIEQFCEAQPLLPAYRAVLERTVASLIEEIHEDVAPYGVSLEGVEPVSAYDWHIVGAYGKSPEEIAAITAAARAKAFEHQRVRVGLRLGQDGPDQPAAISSEHRCRECVAAAYEHGADGIYFYNYSESPRGYLSWIRPSLDGIVPLKAAERPVVSAH